MKQMIRRQKNEMVEAREQEKAFKKYQQRMDLIRRINEENEKRMQIEAEVARLEQEEAQWIKKIQNTNQIQANAHNELNLLMCGDPHELEAAGKN